MNLHLAECIRQFELPQQFPSTIAESNPMLMQTKNIQNIVGTTSLHKMKFIPNAELQLLDNPQKLKLKLPDGRDVGELKFVRPEINQKSKAKLIPISKIGSKLDQSLGLAIKSHAIEKNKPKVKITQILDCSTFDKTIKSQHSHISKIEVQSINCRDFSTKNSLNNQCNPSNFKKITKADKQEINEKRNFIRKFDDELNKLSIKNPNILNEQNNQLQVLDVNDCCSPQEIFKINNANKVIKSLSEKTLSFKILKSNIEGNKNITSNNKNTGIKDFSNAFLLRKRNRSFKDNINHLKHRKSNLFTNSTDSTFVKNSKIKFYYNEQNNCLKINKLSNVPTFENAVDFFPTRSTEKLTIKLNSNGTMKNNTNKTQNYLDDKIIALCNESYQGFKEETENLNEKESLKEKKMSSINNSKNNNIIPSNKQDLFDKLSVLEEAVLSVQDNNLRIKALAALKDCGIKIKKRIPQKRLLSTRVINDSQTQTEIFSLLKKGEFTQVVPKLTNLSRIKQRCLVMKQPINSVLNKKLTKQINSEKNKQFKKELDKVVEKIFPHNKEITRIKEVFDQDKAIQIGEILKQLQVDFKSSTCYDTDGLLGIHRGIIDNNIQEVQKHVILLKALKKDIDICTQDEKTGLELAVEYETDPQIIKLLLSSGAQPVSSKSIHDSAIIIASKKSSRVLSLLLDYTSKKNKLLNSKNSEGFAAIHYCALRGNLEGIMKLLEHDIEVNLQDERCGKTALFYAIDTKSSHHLQDTYYNIAFKLLEYGAVSNIPTFSKHTILSIIDDVKNHSLKIALNKAVQ